MKILKINFLQLKKAVFLIAFFNFLLLFIFKATAQKPMNDYKKMWEEVEKQNQQGLPKSAKDEVEKIFTLAKTEKNTPQIVKTLLHLCNYDQILTDFDNPNDENKTAVHRFLKEINDTQEPDLKALLQSILAEVYSNSFNQNRYEYLNRTQVTDPTAKPTDYRTWDAKRISLETTKLFLASINANPQALTSRSIEYYKDILEQTSNPPNALEVGEGTVCITLYDFLAHRAIKYFTNPQANVTTAKEQFDINQPALFSNSQTFTKTNFTCPDSLSVFWYAIQTFQKLEKIHANDAYPNSNPNALVYNIVERLEFVYNNSSLHNKKELYINALQQLAEQHQKHTAAAYPYYKLAAWYTYNVADATAESKKEEQTYYVKAMKICEETIKKYGTKCLGGYNCQSLQAQIQQKSISIACENYVSPNEPFLAQVQYRNAFDFFGKIIELTPEVIKKFKEIDNDKEYNLRYTKRIQYLNTLTPQATFKADKLPNAQDYQTHSTEIKLPALPIGNYIILMANTPNFEFKENTTNCVAEKNIHITNLSYISSSNNETNEVKIHVLNRKTSQPIPNVKVAVIEVMAGYINGNWKTGEKEVFSANTNAGGVVSFKKFPYTIKNRNGYSHILSLTQDKDALGSQQHDYFFETDPNYIDHNNTPYQQTFFFTDRSIYRPGQVVYFKGIILKTHPQPLDHNLEANQTTTVILTDVNGTEIAKQTLTTNEYGSFAGQFVLPTTGSLTGQFYIGNETGSTNFSVEEYKRPKFEANFLPITGNYKINEKVTITGTAKSYAGVPINDAKVKYRVVRKAFFPYWRCYYWWLPMPQSAEQEIEQGTLTTNDKGEFEVTFTAIPDQTLSASDRPQYSYQIIADVTDLNGETRTANTTVQVGYVAILASINLPDVLRKDSPKNDFAISTTNLNGQHQSTAVQIEIHQLQAPKKLLLPKQWGKSTQFYIPKNEYQQLFENEAYNNENDFNTWQKGEKVFDEKITTQPQSVVQLKKLNQLNAGMYVAELKATDQFGQEVKWLKYFEITDWKTAKIAIPTIFTAEASTNTAEVNQKLQVRIASSAPNARILMQTFWQNKLQKQEWITLKNEQKIISIPIEEKHRGGLTLTFNTILWGRSIAQTEHINVPYTNKELVIETATFRDKLEPGQKETWTLKIKGQKGEKVTAEILASMYDASLDAFVPHQWYAPFQGLFPHYYSYSNLEFSNNFGYDHLNITYSAGWQVRQTGYANTYCPQLNSFGYSMGYNLGRSRHYRGIPQVFSAARAYDKTTVRNKNGENEEIYIKEASSKLEVIPTMAADGAMPQTTAGGAPPPPPPPPSSAPKFDEVQIRKNLQETAFFYPQLKTNANGEVLIEFTTPEALTRWKFQVLAHNPDLQSAFLQKEVVTQKKLMVTPNLPRFLRQNDQITISTKISNLSDQKQNGTAIIKIFDALTMKPLESQFKIAKIEQSFEAETQQSTQVEWQLFVPDNVQAVVIQVLAKADNFSDGEENTLPVLTNQMLVTESLPLYTRTADTKKFTFKKLATANQSSTLRHERLTLEFTSNPAWYAIQSLPYLMEYPYECAEQCFSRYYANSLASHIANSNPNIHKVFEAWKKEAETNAASNADPKNTDKRGALLSNLQKNESLKQMLLEETPWVMQAHNETEQKQRIGVLFDLARMSNELTRAEQKLLDAQMPSGGFAWFKPMPREDLYITQHIVSGMGHLQKLGVKTQKPETQNMLTRAVGFIDQAMQKYYDELLRDKVNLKEYQIDYFQIQYLYARSFYTDQPIAKEHQKAFNFFLQKAENQWLNKSKYMQAQIALASFRFAKKQAEQSPAAQAILKSLKEHLILHDELGAYFQDNVGGWYWYQAPVETQALVIEAFSEIANDTQTVDDLKVWLLKQKQTQHWQTTKATTEAVYALLLQGSNWINGSGLATIKLGNETINPYNTNIEAGTGYFKTDIKATDIKPEMANVSVTPGKGSPITWGALYWQYFENLDKITTATTPVRIKKQVFLKQNTLEGEKLTNLADADNAPLKVGDLLRVRIEIRSDRDLEYVHLKDMRSAGFEPVNVLSSYKYQDGLGYYESTRDAATNFFISYLSKGTYVFEYDLRIFQKGNFSNGITTLQCMYAPEFSSHSEGIRIEVK